MNKTHIIFTFLCLVYINTFTQVNLSYNLYHKTYDKIAYLTTHNSFNSVEGNFQIPNQTYGITRQLNDGVRALMLDVYDRNGVATVYHGYQWLGSVPLVSNLNEVKLFLENNPNEVVTIIFECYVSADMIEMAIESSGLSDLLYIKLQSQPWSTLQQMIDSNKRLVIFSDRNDAGITQAWYHYIWHHAVETHFSVSGISDFSCEFNRGNPNNDLVILNHFITPNYGIPQISTAQTANSNPFLINRALECWDEHDKFPNFVTVDFYEVGDCLDVVNILNTMQLVNINNESFGLNQISIYPNPASDFIFVEAPNIIDVQVYTLCGKLLTAAYAFSDRIEISLLDYTCGMYIINTSTKHGIYSNKLLIIR